MYLLHRVTKQWQFTRQELHQKNQAFKLHHAWNILKDYPRWRTDANQQCGRLFHIEAPPLNDVNEGVEQMTLTSSFARPPGRDKQKEAKRKGKSQGLIRQVHKLLPDLQE